MRHSERHGANRPWTIALAGAACMLAAQSVPAQAPDQQIIPSYRDSDIRVLIEGVQAVTGRPMIVDPRVRANVTLYNSTPMSPEAFWDAFLQILEVHGYMAVDDGTVVQILPDANARQYAGAEDGDGAEIVTQTIELRNVGAAQLVPILRPMMPQYAHLAAHQTANLLILSDRASNMARMVDIIRRIDRAGSEQVEIIPLENADAAEVVRMLSTMTQASAAASGVPAVQAFADERTNSVMLAGSASAKADYRELISSLDTPSQTGGETLVRYLNYADAEDLATKLQAQYGAQVQTAEGAAAAGPNAGTISIWPDPGTNALVINAPARIREDMERVLDMIDIRRLQVLVDAIIVEVSEEKAAELGLTWIFDGSSDDEAVGLTNFSNTTPGILGLAQIGASDSPNPSSLPQGITMAVGRIRDAGTSWAAVISALRGDAGTNIISTPTITVLDNEEAEIRVGQEVPFLTGQFTSTGASEGSVNPFQTIQREEVGTSLKITPQINEGTGVKLAIEQETSGLTAGAAGAVDLVTNTRSIVTSVFVEDGDVLILGGLIDDSLRQSEQRVPGLGNIPGLRWLFGARKTERVKSNLMVFIRPTILRDPAGASDATRAKYSQIEELQNELAEEPVPLMRREPRPELPPLPDDGAQSAPAPAPEENPASGSRAP